MAMVGYSDNGASRLDFPAETTHGLRFLNGGNNNNNNNNNNNQDGNNQNYNNYNNGNAFYADFDFQLLAGTIGFCVLVTLLVIMRVSCHKRSERRRRRLGISKSNVRRSRKRSITNNLEDGDDNIVTDEEIRRFILPSKQEKSIEEAAKVVRCDRETDRIMDLCRPFWLQAIVSGICDVVNTALLGRYLGVDALAIYFIVTVPTSFTETIIEAVLDTVSSLSGQSVGVGSYKLTGQYCQISIILVRIHTKNVFNSNNPAFVDLSHIMNEIRIFLIILYRSHIHSFISSL